MPIIEVNHVTKEYQLGQLQSMKTTLFNKWRRLRGHSIDERPPFKALDDVNFSIEQGEVVGIIGHNGAGKSTLLKLLANISKPSSGTVQVKGKIAPLIEVGAGLVGDLTGRENIYLNGAILGIPKVEIRRKFDDIVAFAELEEFIDTPIKRYSSGMQVRLGFSIATSVESDILIVDEVLAVGDLAFQRKCFDRMEDLIKRQGKTVLLVSHNIRQVERLSGRAILLDHGQVAADGLPEVVCDLFFARSDEKIKTQIGDISTSSVSTEEFDLIDLKFINKHNCKIDRVESNSDVTASMHFRVHKELRNPTFGLGIHTPDFLYLATQNTENIKHYGTILPGEYVLRCKIIRFPFLPGIYSLRAGVTDGEAVRTVFYAENLFHFQVIPKAGGILTTSARDGFVTLDVDWSLDDIQACKLKEGR
ncbi:ABC transporter ATP-binding protein [Candidatus Nitrotoga arctica]|uniref:Teichoic acid export ATP-binding protein TagH n=1 Tax=Candidatus Nitrotoga arctica TaxID=453162 RepID=A0ABN8AM46_9PROT|nr:ABC transporter ATP-binding protein [Candidatus Nitrotoga arctica]CAG9932796.1 Teichoic acid export ATP-binding protein TagH [Candidatus Nitrotoga arctica]